MTSRSRHPVATLLLSHGAGAGIDTADLEALAATCPATASRWSVSSSPGRSPASGSPPGPPSLDDALVAAANRLRTRTPLVVGGRSAGARSAARCARQLGAAGCLALSFPLHPVGHPEKSRLDELRGAGVPTLVVQGEKDAMGRPEEFPPDVDLAVVPNADHGLKVPVRGDVTQHQALGVVVEATLEWLVREVIGEGSGGSGAGAR